MTTGRSEAVVSEQLTARHMGSGSLRVYATPALVALMEQAAVNALAGQLEEGITTVGVAISLEHTAATPVGMRVWAEARLTESDGRRFQFEIEAFDERGPIGKASHIRASVKAQRFQEKTDAK